MATSSTLKVNQVDFLPDVTWQQLRQGNRATLQSFKLPLVDSEHNLLCHEIVRVLPGKRLVAFGLWNQKPVVAKLFYSARAAIHARREVRGNEALHKAGILSPKIFFAGTAQLNKVYVLIFERISGGYNLDEIWDAKPSLKDVTPLMHALTIELATQHVMGILQNDLHFKNFIIKRKKVYTLDAGDMEIFESPLTKKESLDNLGLYFSQMGLGTEAFCKDLFTSYVRARGWLVSKFDRAFLESATLRWTAKRVADYSEKIMRNSTDTALREELTQMALYHRSYESQNLFEALSNPDKQFTDYYAKILKAGNSTTVAKIQLDDKNIVLKRYNVKSFWHWLRRCKRSTRAVSGWKLAHQLNLLGIATAKPIACIEKRLLGFRGKSYLFMEYVDGVHAGTFFLDNDPTQGVGLKVAQEIVNIIQQLASINMTHGDLKMSNILIAKNKPVLIDLDGMTVHRTQRAFERAYQAEIDRFMRNWELQPETYGVFETLLGCHKDMTDGSEK